MRKQLLIVPAILAILIGGIALSRLGREEPELTPKEVAILERPKPERAKPRPRLVVASRPKPLPPPPAKAPAEVEGRMLHSNAMRQQVGVYVRAALRGDHATADALYSSLERNKNESLLAAKERLAFSESSQERKVLTHLIGGLR